MIEQENFSNLISILGPSSQPQHTVYDYMTMHENCDEEGYNIGNRTEISGVLRIQNEVGIIFQLFL